MYRYWFASLDGLHAKEKIQLVHLFGTEKEIYKTTEKEWKEISWLDHEKKQVILTNRITDDFYKKYEIFSKQSIRLLTFTQKEYPQKLKEIYDPPYGLFVKGNLPGQDQLQVGIVGARGCSPYGQTIAKELAIALAGYGISVISGLAHGIDSAAHIGAIQGGGQTYGILGCGINVCYPAGNEKLYEQVVSQGGIISEYDLEFPPMKHTFPRRNRIISGLSDIVVVVEARKKSGSLITAEHALEQGKTIYAVPGRISDSLSFGTNWLISQGASPLYSIEEFLKDMGKEVEQNNGHKKLMENSLEKTERLVYSVLDFTPIGFETILERTGLGITEITIALFHLTECGIVKEISRNYYIKNCL